MKWYPPGTIKRLYWIPSMQKNPDLLFNSFPLVTHFTLSKNYNDPIGKIPPGMLQINWGRTFNHPLPLSLLKSPISFLATTSSNIFLHFHPTSPTSDLAHVIQGLFLTFHKLSHISRLPATRNNVLYLILHFLT